MTSSPSTECWFLYVISDYSHHTRYKTAGQVTRTVLKLTNSKILLKFKLHWWGVFSLSSHDTIKANICLFPFFFQVKFLIDVLFFPENWGVICSHIKCWKVCNMQSWRREAGKCEWLQHLPQIWYYWVDRLFHKQKRNALVKMGNSKRTLLGLAQPYLLLT